MYRFEQKEQIELALLENEKQIDHNGHNSTNGHGEDNHQNESHNQAAQGHDSHDEHSGHDEGESNVFIEILGELSDHDSFTVGPYKLFDLPKIYIDNGFHYYPNYEAVEQSGLYEVHNHHGHHEVINKSTGEPPQLDLSITNFVMFQWLAIIPLLFIFGAVGRKYNKNPKKAPSGLQNLIEVFYLYIRDEVVRANIPSRKAADNLQPYFLALFFFILFMNLLGLLPGGHTATGSVSTTAALAITSFFVINITAISVTGIKHWFAHLLGGAPWYMAPIMVPIEIAGLIIKPFALTIRLFANMTAGHVVLFALLGLLFFFNTLLLSPAITGFSIFIYALELLVAFIQAYLFTVLTALFTGLAIGEHSEEHAH